MCRLCSDPWRRHRMETFSALLALCAGNSPVTGEFPSQRPVTRSFDVFLDLRLNKRLSKQSGHQWYETPSRSLWRHCNVISWVKQNSSTKRTFWALQIWFLDCWSLIQNVINIAQTLSATRLLTYSRPNDAQAPGHWEMIYSIIAWRRIGTKQLPHLTMNKLWLQEQPSLKFE